MEIDLGAGVGTGHDPGPSEHGHPAGELHTLPVHVTGTAAPVRVQQGPYDQGTARTKTIGVTAVQIQPADHHRGRVLLVGQAPFLVAFVSEVDASQDAAAQMGWWPANVPLEVRHRSTIWAAAASGTCALTILTERFSDTQVGGLT